MKQYAAHTALSDDVNEGWVWVRDSDANVREKLQGQRHVVCVSRKKTKVYCEALYADDRYMDRWDEILMKRLEKHIIRTADRIFINAWYQNLLGIKSPQGLENKDITIEFAKSLMQKICWQFKACLQHPQLVVLLATVLGIIGVALGFIGVGLGLPAFWPTEKYPDIVYFSGVFIVSGTVIFICGIIPLFRRVRA